MHSCPRTSYFGHEFVDMPSIIARQATQDVGLNVYNAEAAERTSKERH